MANEQVFEDTSVRLSGKEVPGLAARVLGTALMPWGASGGAAKAIEFGELSGAGRLRALVDEIETFGKPIWHAPDIVEEHAAHALCDARGGSALFFGASLADWVDAWLVDAPSVALVMRNLTHAHDLQAVPFWLARRGHASCALIAAGEQSWRFCAASASDDGWRYAAWDGDAALRVAPDDFAHALQASDEHLPDLQAFDALRAAGAAWLEGGATTRQSHADHSSGAVIVATSGNKPLRWLAHGAARTLNSSTYAALKARVLAEGWPIPRSEWEALMRYADRSLITTSERSREGAG